MSNCLCLACDRENSITTKFCGQCGAKLQIQERYRALKVIGQGGFGKTFLAQDESKPSQPRCVIKQFAFETINPNASQGTLDVAIRLFEQEAKRLDDLGKHPQIPELLSFTIHEGKQYLIQEFIDGETLEQELARVGAFSEQQVRDVLVEVLQILEFVHSKSVIHRDISPDNIIRRRSDQKLVLVDFGAAKHATATLLAKTGTGIGKPSYGAPEQMLGKSVFQSDLFGLGVTCLHLLTNVEPFTLYDVLENEYQWRQFLNGKLVSNEFGKLLDRLIAQKVKDRPNSALDVLQKLGIAQKEIKKNGLTNLKNRFTTSIHKYSGSMRNNRGDYQGALDDYSEIIRLNPNNLSAYYDRGNVKNKLGDYQGAIDDYSKVISLNPNNSFAYYERGNMKNKLGNYKGALDDYSKAIRLNPNDSSAYNERKQLRNKLGDSQGALDDYTEVIIFNPNNFSAYYDRGSLKNSLGDFQGALDDYSEAIRLDPHNASAYYDRGELRSNLSDYKGALNDYTSAISFNHQIDHSYYGSDAK